MKEQKIKTVEDIGLGILVGGGVGLVVSAFRWGIAKILHEVIAIYHYLTQNIWYLPLWILFLIGVGLVLAMITQTDPHIKGSGIPQVELQVNNQIQMNWWSVLWKKFVVGALAIGSGLLLGREGPSIQLGSVVGMGFAKAFNKKDAEQSLLLASGAGAGVAAAFNAPLAGVMFVLEEVYQKFNNRLMVISLVSAIIANGISKRVFGLKPSLPIDNQMIFPVEYYGLLVLLGIFLSLFALMYWKVTLTMPDKLRVLFPKFDERLYPSIALLLIVPLGFFASNLLGGGGSLVLELITSNYSIILLLGIFMIRFIYSAISYSSGLPGGIFLPILSLGAVLGVIFGKIFVIYFGLPETLLSTIVMFAMASYFAAISKAPLTAIVLVSEMVGGMTQLFPLAICVFVAYSVANLLGIEPIYEVMSKMYLQKQTATSNVKTKNKKVRAVANSYN